MRAGFASFSATLLATLALCAQATPTEQQQIEINHCTIMSKAVLEFAKARDQGLAKMDAYDSVTHGQQYKAGSMVDQTLQWAYEHADENAEAASAHFYGHCSLDALEALTPQTEEQAKSAAATCQQQNTARPDETRICMDDKISALIAAANTPPLAPALSPAAPAQSQVLASVQAPSAPAAPVPAPAPTLVVAPAPEVAQAEAPAQTQIPAATEQPPVAMPIPAPVRAKPAVPAAAPAPSLAQTTVPGSAPAPVAAPKPAPMAVPTAQPTDIPAPAVSQTATPLTTPEPTPVEAPEPEPVAPAPVVAQAPAPVVVPAPAPAVARAPQPAPGIAAASSALVVKTPEPAPAKLAAAAPATSAAELKLAVLSPPSLGGIGKLQLGMAMSDAMHTFHSYGDEDRDEFGAETQTFLISDGHGYVVLLTQRDKPDTLYGIEYHGGADADTAPTILGVRLGQSALAVLTHVGEPSRRERLPNSEFTRWYYDGRNYSFDISSGGDLVTIRLYGYDGLQSPDADSDTPAPTPVTP